MEEIAQNGMEKMRKGRSLPQRVRQRSMITPEIGSSRASHIVETMLRVPKAVPDKPMKLIMKYCFVAPTNEVRLLIEYEVRANAAISRGRTSRFVSRFSVIVSVALISLSFIKNPLDVKVYILF